MLKARGSSRATVCFLLHHFWTYRLRDTSIMAEACENPLLTSTPEREASGSVFLERKQERV